MKGTNPFGFGFPVDLSNGFRDDLDEEDMFENYYSDDWSLPKNVLEETGIFDKPINDNYPMFYFDDRNPQVQNSKPRHVEEENGDHAVCLSDENKPQISQLSQSIQIVAEIASPHKVNADSSNIYKALEKTEIYSNRKDSTENDDSLSDSKPNSEATIENSEEMSAEDQKVTSPSNPQSESPASSKVVKPTSFDEKEDNLTPEDDPDFCYKAPRKQKFEYNKRKDVILKTILRKCRRILQDDFNGLTDYFQNRKMQGHQFLKDCVLRFHDSIPNKPEQLDLVFYLGAILYPQEMNRGVDCFFECDKKDRVKQRKFYRAKIQKVHDVLYRYSHEKMDYFVKVPELSYLYTLFYKKEIEENNEDQYYINGATEIFERCIETLASANISI